MEPKQHCHFEQRQCARFASALVESRNLLFAGAHGADGPRRLHGSLVENSGSVSAARKQQVPRLRRIVRLANDLAALGMTGLREHREQGVRRAA